MHTQHTFKAEEFCSTKLWELVRHTPEAATAEDVQAAIAELAQRRHYLKELEKLGIFQL